MQQTLNLLRAIFKRNTVFKAQEILTWRRWEEDGSIQKIKPFSCISIYTIYFYKQTKDQQCLESSRLSSILFFNQLLAWNLINWCWLYNWFWMLQSFTTYVLLCKNFGSLLLLDTWSGWMVWMLKHAARTAMACASENLWHCPDIRDFAPYRNERQNVGNSEWKECRVQEPKSRNLACKKTLMAMTFSTQR